MELPKRKINRLQEYDYSQNGGYFITICTKNKENMLIDVGATCGRPLQIEWELSSYGEIVEQEINKIEKIYHGIVRVDKYVIMPNHIHMILIISNELDGRPQVITLQAKPPTVSATSLAVSVAPTISRVIQQFKGSITKQLGVSIWQKLFHDHVIRNEKSYLKIWQYIDTNSLKWELDIYYTD